MSLIMSVCQLRRDATMQVTIDVSKLFARLLIHYTFKNEPKQGKHS
jgi:hypothetical protein